MLCRWFQRRYATLWSTGANQPASDGNPSDGHGPFAKSLVNRITHSKNLRLVDLADQLDADVSLKTKNSQGVHFYHRSLEGVTTLFDHLGSESTASTDLESRSSLTSFTSDRNDRNCARCFGISGRKALGLISLFCIVIVAALIAVSWLCLRDHPVPPNFSSKLNRACFRC